MSNFVECEKTHVRDLNPEIEFHFLRMMFVYNLLCTLCLSTQDVCVPKCKLLKIFFKSFSNTLGVSARVSEFCCFSSHNTGNSGNSLETGTIGVIV